jgi:adenylate cyclase
VNNEYILVVDDDWMNREVIEAYLTSDGYEVQSVSSGQDALETAAERPPALVLLDVNMPGMNGYEVCEHLKYQPETKFTPIMFITALETDEDKLRAIEAGADDFLTKPFNSLIMLTRVRSLIRIRRLHEEVEERNRLLRQVLNRYVAEEITEVILADPEKNLKLGGETRRITVFFADIRGFTSFAEQHEAGDVLTILNDIFSELTDIVFHYHGTFDKYMGDEIMGFFGAPIAGEDDAYQALCMALEMQHVFASIRDNFEDPRLRQLGLGIGLHTGEAAVGNIGSEQAMNYTVIGDTVNIARRLQQSAAHGDILISDSTLDEVNGRVEAEPLEPLYVQGKSEPLTAYRLLGVQE